MPITGHSSILTTQEAIASILTNASAFTSICGGPFDPAPLNQPFPYAAFGNHVETGWQKFGRASKKIDFVILVYSQQPSYTEALTIIDVINSLIEATTLSLTGGNFTNIQNGVLFLSATKCDESDGITRHVEGRWRIWNEAN